MDVCMTRIMQALTESDVDAGRRLLQAESRLGPYKQMLQWDSSIDHVVHSALRDRDLLFLGRDGRIRLEQALKSYKDALNVACTIIAADSLLAINKAFAELFSSNPLSSVQLVRHSNALTDSSLCKLGAICVVGPLIASYSLYGNGKNLTDLLQALRAVSEETLSCAVLVQSRSNGLNDNLAAQDMVGLNRKLWSLYLKQLISSVASICRSRQLFHATAHKVRCALNTYQRYLQEQSNIQLLLSAHESVCIYLGVVLDIAVLVLDETSEPALRGRIRQEIHACRVQLGHFADATPTASLAPSDAPSQKNPNQDHIVPPDVANNSTPSGRRSANYEYQLGSAKRLFSHINLLIALLGHSEHSVMTATVRIPPLPVQVTPVVSTVAGLTKTTASIFVSPVLETSKKRQSSPSMLEQQEYMTFGVAKVCEKWVHILLSGTDADKVELSNMLTSRSSHNLELANMIIQATTVEHTREEAQLHTDGLCELTSQLSSALCNKTRPGSLGISEVRGPLEAWQLKMAKLETFLLTVSRQYCLLWSHLSEGLKQCSHSFLHLLFVKACTDSDSICKAISSLTESLSLSDDDTVLMKHCTGYVECCELVKLLMSFAQRICADIHNLSLVLSEKGPENLNMDQVSRVLLSSGVRLYCSHNLLLKQQKDCLQYLTVLQLKKASERDTRCGFLCTLLAKIRRLVELSDTMHMKALLSMDNTLKFLLDIEEKLTPDDTPPDGASSAGHGKIPENTTTLLVCDATSCKLLIQIWTVTSLVAEVLQDEMKIWWELRSRCLELGALKGSERVLEMTEILSDIQLIGECWDVVNTHVSEVVKLHNLQYREVISNAHKEADEITKLIMRVLIDLAEKKEGAATEPPSSEINFDSLALETAAQHRRLRKVLEKQILARGSTSQHLVRGLSALKALPLKQKSFTKCIRSDLEASSQKLSENVTAESVPSSVDRSHIKSTSEQLKASVDIAAAQSSASQKITTTATEKGMQADNSQQKLKVPFKNFPLNIDCSDKNGSNDSVDNLFLRLIKISNDTSAILRRILDYLHGKSPYTETSHVVDAAKEVQEASLQMNSIVASLLSFLPNEECIDNLSQMLQKMPTLSAQLHMLSNVRLPMKGGRYTDRTSIQQNVQRMLAILDELMNSIESACVKLGVRSDSSESQADETASMNVTQAWRVVLEHHRQLAYHHGANFLGLRKINRRLDAPKLHELVRFSDAL